MTNSGGSSSVREDPAEPESLEMPRATPWPIVLALGLALLGAGLATSLVLALVGALLFVFGLGGWIGQLLPGRGHVREPLVEPALRSGRCSKGPVRWISFVPAWPVIGSDFPRKFTPYPPESRVVSWEAW